MSLGTLWNFGDLLERIENQISTWFNQEAWVGVNCAEIVTLMPHVASVLVVDKLSRNDMDFLVTIGGDDVVHEVKGLYDGGACNVCRRR
jgi:hypothetical protein